ncbi:PepSY domain-containing protein [Oscillochloris sp. ZM17-4]|uniref:PepSY domain-containing protein n=1 Tax=Oscillochloris sp. ZM17-4 TaxID=2866714 RepID=UPI001C72BC7E|nr:PepSY domain-containing protein [Oscillochloris sp. ZM17-4]MBX0328661.1 PepSY domain-containing protein [Oscillochloris sp. ZM17-4]
MNQRSALLIAAALTAFLLVLAGGLASRLSTAPDLGATEVAAIPTEASPPTEVVTLDPTVEALIKEREAAYQQALAEANSRLNQANEQIAQANGQISALDQSRQDLADQLNQVNQSQPVVVAAPVAVAAAPAQAPAPAAPAAAPAPAPAEPTYAVSADQARDIALGVAAAGANLQKAPELVNYQGTPAYEVVLDKGNVYIDARNGAVLWNGAAAPQLISQDQAIQSAQAYLGGGTVKSVNLQDDNGAQTYQVQFSDDSKVYVDAISGQVVYAEIRTSGTQYASGGGDDHDDHEGGEHEGGDHEGGEHEGGEHDD